MERSRWETATEWEKDFGRTLEAWHQRLTPAKAFNYGRARDDGEQLKEALEPLLYNAPLAYRGMVLSICLTAADREEWNAYRAIEEHLGIQPATASTGERRYRVPLLTPRLANWEKSGFSAWKIAHKGTYVRDYAAKHPDLKTIVLEPVFADPITKQNMMLGIRPQANIVKMAGCFDIFPRNLLGITLTEELPPYLTEGKREGLVAWYEQEMGS